MTAAALFYPLPGVPAPVHAALQSDVLAFLIFGLALFALILLTAGSRIIERSRTAGALARARRELEGQVAERTSELARANEELRAENAERSRVESALRESEARYRLLFEDSQERATYLKALVENSPLAILTLNVRHRIEIANPAFVRLFGYTHEELHGQDPDDLIAPNDGELRSEATAFTQDCLSGRAIHAATTRRRKDGRLVEVEIIGVPLMAGGRLIGVYAMYQDVTERKELSEQLRQAQKMDAVGRLAGGIAHDFNNLLTVILGSTELLLDGTGENHPMREELREIRAAGERAATLTRQLLAFSRKQVLRPEVLDLNALLRDMERLLRRLLGEDVEMVSALREGLWSVRADPGQIEQAVLNLAVNARDAMPHGGRIRIQTENVSIGPRYASQHRGMRTGDYVEISVADTGIGMDEGVRSRLFEPFFTTKPAGKGTGLGLSTTYGIVKQSGGYIWADSDPGKGSCFRIHLPRVEAEARREVKRPEAPSTRGSETILLVEDEPQVRFLLERVLQAQGYRVLVASRPSEAISLSSHADVHLDLIVTDVVMPEMNGRDLANVLGAHRPSLPVLFVSGYSEDAITGDGVLEPGTVFVQKPFQPGDLARKVRETLDAGVRVN